MKKLPLLFLLASLAYLPVSAQSSYDLQLKAGTFPLKEKSIPGEGQLASAFFDGKYYLLLQFYQTPGEEQIKALALKGVSLDSYIPNRSYHASLNSNLNLSDLLQSGVRAISVFQPSWKINPSLLTLTPVNPDQPVRLTVVHFKGADPEKIASRLKQLQATILGQSPLFQRMDIEIPLNFLNQLSAEAWLSWIEAATGPMQEDNLPGKTLTRSSTIGGGTRKLNGSGVIVGVWDGGQVGPHVDFNARQINVTTALVSTHSTHVSGTIGGSGTKDPDACGMAPKATIYNWDFVYDIPSQMSAAVTSQKIVTTNNSYTLSSDPCATRGTYDTRSHDLDLLVNTTPYLTHVFAAGNTQDANCAGSGSDAGFRTVYSATQSAKNAICVGAVDKLDAMTSFSCWGPVRDNRLKPEVVAVGYQVNSTYPNSTYSTIDGTSMACPNVTGVVAQIFERYRQLHSRQNPDAALVRNVLANTAEDLGNPGPDYKFGYGRVHALRAVKLLEAARFTSDTIKPGSQGKTYSTPSIPAKCKRMRIMITWNDPAASASASPALVNDLDLTVKDKLGNSILPWLLSPTSYNSTAIRAKDGLNNIEQVTIDNPDTSAGAYTVLINGTVNSGSSQKFFITYEFEEASIEITYPAGGEVFVPSTTEIIRWDSRWVTGNVQLHYSLNAGQSWTQLTVSTMAASLKYYSWSVPSSLMGSKVMVRVRTLDSSVTGKSDTTFTVLGRPSMSTKTCSGQVHVSWGTVTGAIAYEPFILLNNQLVSQGITSNLFYTFKGLAGNTEYYFAVRAIGPDSVKGKMPVAINLTLSSSSIPPAFTTDLPALSSVCLNGNIVLKTKTIGAATLSRVWQRSTNGGGVWSTIAGNTDSLVLNNVNNTLDQYQYRMNLTSSTCGNTVSTTPTVLRVDTGLIRTSSPQNQTACYGTPMNFSYGVISKSLPLSKWQVRKIGDSTWKAFNTVFDTTLTFNAPDTLNNYNIRVISSNGCVLADTSAEATIFVNSVDSSWAYSITGHQKFHFTPSQNDGSSYLWDFGDGTQATVQDTTHTYSTDGTYKVCLSITKNGCTVSRCQNISVISTGEAERVSPSSQFMEVYPNPAGAELFINASQSLGLIHIYDRLGREVIRTDAGQLQGIRISLQDLDNGIYILRTTQGSRKIIIMK